MEYLTYSKPQDEEDLYKTLTALEMEFGSNQIIICLPASWRQYRSELSTGFPGELAYLTKDTIEVSVRGTDINHTVQLKEMSPC